MADEMKTWTLPHYCGSCGRECSVTLQEPLHDQSGKNTRFIAATGCFRVTDDGALLSWCEEHHA